jgi:hypothetical protein
LAIHATVFYSPDRHIRITADPGGRVFTVERDLVFVVKLTSLAMLESWLRRRQSADRRAEAGQG